MTKTIEKTVNMPEMLPSQEQDLAMELVKRLRLEQSGRTEREKKCIPAEEPGHYHTGFGDIPDQSSAANRKQELRGRLRAYNRLIGLHGQETLFCHRRKYGIYVKLDNYVICYEPSIGVFEMNSEKSKGKRELLCIENYCYCRSFYHRSSLNT